MKSSIQKLVWSRAHARCEFCQIAQEFDELTFEIDHVIPIKHGGKTNAANLALACFPCNHHKSSDLSGVDPETQRIVRLFHPRTNEVAPPFPLGRPLAGRTHRDWPSNNCHAQDKCTASNSPEK